MEKIKKLESENWQKFFKQSVNKLDEKKNAALDSVRMLAKKNSKKAEEKQRKKISELELCKRFEGDFEGVALYFFKQTKMNPEEDILKSHLPNLKSALEKFKVFVGRNYSKEVASILNLEGGTRRYKTGVKHVSWEYLYFNAVPFEVAVRNINQLQLAIRIIESSCVQ